MRCNPSTFLIAVLACKEDHLGATAILEVVLRWQGRCVLVARMLGIHVKRQGKSKTCHDCLDLIVVRAGGTECMEICQAGR